jgi:hypothetical protein
MSGLVRPTKNGGTNQYESENALGYDVMQAPEVDDDLNTIVDYVNSLVLSGGIPDGGVTTAKLADLSVTTAKLANGAVTNAKVTSVDYAKITNAPVLAFLPLMGGALTGPLTLAADPGSPLQAATKQYVDAHASGGGGGIPEAPTDGKLYGRGGATPAWAAVLPLAGGTLTGALLLAADPAVATGAATKRYVDTKDALALPLAGGTLTGPLLLAANPTAPLGAATKQYVDAHASGGIPEAPTDGKFYGRGGIVPDWNAVLSIAGGTLNGPLTLAGDPANPLHAATKQYVDAHAGSGGGGGGFWSDDTANAVLLPVPPTRSLQLDPAAAVHFGNPLGGAPRISSDGSALLVHGMDSSRIDFDIGGAVVFSLDGSDAVFTVPVTAPNFPAPPPTSIMIAAWTSDVALTSTAAVIGTTMGFSPAQFGLAGKNVTVRAVVVFEVTATSIVGPTLFVRLNIKNQSTGGIIHGEYQGMIVNVPASTTRQFSMPYTVGATLDDPSTYIIVEVAAWWSNDPGTTCKQKSSALEATQ